MRTDIVIDTSVWIDCFTGAPLARATGEGGGAAERDLRARISEKARAPEQ